MMKKTLICTVCPAGCQLEAEVSGKHVISVLGNTCPRGEKYAKDECIAPKRMVTSTVRCSNGELLSVKTKDAIPKEKISECMKIINNTVVDLPISVSDVIIKDVFGTCIVATKNMRA